MKFTRIGMLVVITAAVVYIGLSLIFPHKQANLAVGTDADSAHPAAGSGSEASSSVVADSPPPASPPAQTGDQSAAASDAQQKPPAEAASNANPEPSSSGTPTSAADSSTSGVQTPETSTRMAQSSTGSGAEPKKTKRSHVVATTSTVASSVTGTQAGGLVQTGKASAWWGQHKDGQLNLLFAGETAFDAAIALLFSDDVGIPASTPGQHIRILDGSQKPATGQWQINPQNTRMLVFKTKPGAYTVTLDADLVSLSGKKLGSRLHGPVYVQ